MADIVVAKLQNRRGLRKDLPQPLSPGELGLCIDTGQLFIGADSDDPNSIISLIIELNTPTITSENLANQIIQLQLIQYNFHDVAAYTVTTYDSQSPNYVADALTDKEIELRDLLAASVGFDANQATTQIIIVSHVVEMIPDAGYPAAERWNFRGYLVFDVPTALPSPITNTDNDFFAIESGLVFAEGMLDLGASAFPYLMEDSGAVATLILEVDGTDIGLVNVLQNIEIFTSHTDILDTVFPRIPYSLPVSDGIWANVGGATMDLTQEDAFLMEYSLKDETGGSSGSPATYSRTGTFQVVTDGDVIAFLNDTFAEITASIGMTVDFQMLAAADALQLQYKTTGTPPTLALTISTRGWKSF